MTRQDAMRRFQELKALCAEAGAAMAEATRIGASELWETAFAQKEALIEEALRIHKETYPGVTAEEIVEFAAAARSVLRD